jgi:hypothetical protein
MKSRQIIQVHFESGRIEYLQGFDGWGFAILNQYEEHANAFPANVALDVSVNMKNSLAARGLKDKVSHVQFIDVPGR